MIKQTFTIMAALAMAAPVFAGQQADAARQAADAARDAAQQARENLKAATSVWSSGDIQQAIAAAHDAATIWKGGDMLATSGWGQKSASDEAAREKERAQRDRDREYSYYDQGQSALDSSKWDRAITAFDRVIEMNGPKADAALYWKAYAQNKLGQKPEALA